MGHLWPRFNGVLSGLKLHFKALHALATVSKWCSSSLTIATFNKSSATGRKQLRAKQTRLEKLQKTNFIALKHILGTQKYSVKSQEWWRISETLVSHEVSNPLHWPSDENYSRIGDHVLSTRTILIWLTSPKKWHTYSETSENDDKMAVEHWRWIIEQFCGSPSAADELSTSLFDYSKRWIETPE